MSTDNIQTFTFKLEDDEGKLVVKGEISGKTEIPLFDDLKFNGIIALLHSIDKENFSKSDKNHLFDHYLKEIEETISEMKKYNQFQGRRNEDH
nr:hypothetical protein [Neobacillus sp. Marseille-Q6967]